MLLTIVLFALPIGLLLLPLLLGMISPEEYTATVTGVIDAPPEEVFRRIEDVEENPGSGAMARSVEMLPEDEWEEGQRAWIEDIGSTRIRVQTVEIEEQGRCREIVDRRHPGLLSGLPASSLPAQKRPVMPMWFRRAAGWLWSSESFRFRAGGGQD